MSDFGSFLAELRAHGVTEITLKLSAAAPAPEPPLGGMTELGADVLERILSGPPADEKAPGSCAAPGCGAPGGHPYAPDYCREHALAAAGVT